MLDRLWTLARKVHAFDGLAGILALLCVVGSVESGGVSESWPLLVFAVTVWGLGRMATATVLAATAEAKRALWDDRGTRRAIFVAAGLSFAGGLLGMGLGGVIPVAFAMFVHHPLSVVDALARLNSPDSPLGEDAWPFLIVSGLLWPWWLPVSRWIGVRFAPEASRALFVVPGTILGSTVQSVVLSYVMVGRNIFW